VVATTTTTIRWPTTRIFRAYLVSQAVVARPVRATTTADAGVTATAMVLPMVVAAAVRERKRACQAVPGSPIRCAPALTHSAEAVAAGATATEAAVAAGVEAAAAPVARPIRCAPTLAG
jgi:hypothetical protein